MSHAPLFALDLVAIAILTFALYFPRHRRAEMLVAYLTVNVGVLAVAEALSSAAVGVGLGLGLFGVLAIVRLRSVEMDQHEIAYYFAALALGLVGGLSTSPAWLAAALMGAVLVALYVGDHPRLTGDRRGHRMILDGAYTDEVALVARLETVLGGRVDGVRIRKVDLVGGSTQVDVRYTVARGAPTDRVPDDRTLSDR